ncbi:MAG: transposase [Agitococcus sp.]|nr:transposase [Agitococcus sp.]
MSSTLQSGVRFPASPTPEQAVALSRWIGSQRFIYNGKVNEDKLHAAQRRMALKQPSESSVDTINVPIDSSYTQFRTAELSPWLAEIPSQVLRQGVGRYRAAKQRQLVGLACMPRSRNRSNFTSVVLDKDMFAFHPKVDAVTGTVTQELHLGGKGKFSIGVLKFKAHRPFGIPNMLVIRRTGRGWFVSFSYAHDSPVLLRESHELAYELDGLDDAALSAAVLGFDRNIKHNAFAGSDGRFYMLEEKVLARIERKRVATKRYQQRYARCKKGSKNQSKARLRVAISRQYETNALRDFAHQTSHHIVSDPGILAIALEALKLANMVRKPKTKFDETTGKWLKNGARAKAGLNRKLLSRALGTTVSFIQYKAVRANKLVVTVSPYNSSNECSECGHTHPENRHQQRFLCQRCCFSAHADTNAGLVVKKRAIAQIRSTVLQAPRKRPKRVSIRRKVLAGAAPLPNVEGVDNPGLSVESV